MKYEIITDKEDLLVLVVNNRVIAVSSDMPTVIEIMHKNYEDTVNKTQRVYLPALIHPELDDDMYKDEEITVKEDIKKDTPKNLQELADRMNNETPSDKKPDASYLGRLFSL